jgi:hypothetical protein
MNFQTRLAAKILNLGGVISNPTEIAVVGEDLKANKIHT